MRATLCLCFALVALPTLLAAAPGRAQAPDDGQTGLRATLESLGAAAPWRTASLWDDGNAEYCAYEIDWARYGTTYPGRALLITVKEPWAPDLDVKADRPRPDGFEVLKLNHIRDVPTGIYTYHQMASVYLRRDSGVVQKIAATSSEACGVSTALMTDRKLALHSYFDGVGDRVVDYPRAAVPRDGLPMILRDYAAQGSHMPDALSVIPELMSSRLDDVTPRSHRLTRERGGLAEVPAGAFDVVTLTLRPANGSGGTLVYRFEETPPHRLVSFEETGGTRYRMSKCERIPYWRMSRPGDETWLPEEVR